MVQTPYVSCDSMFSLASHLHAMHQGTKSHFWKKKGGERERERERERVVKKLIKDID